MEQKADKYRETGRRINATDMVMPIPPHHAHHVRIPSYQQACQHPMPHYSNGNGYQMPYTGYAYQPYYRSYLNSDHRISTLSYEQQQAKHLHPNQQKYDGSANILLSKRSPLKSLCTSSKVNLAGKDNVAGVNTNKGNKLNTGKPLAVRAYVGKRNRSRTSTSIRPQRKRKKMYSDYIGVTFNKTHNKFQACITHYRKQHYLGRYKLAADAAKAYDDNARKLKGIHWKVNFQTQKSYFDARAREENVIGNAVPLMSRSKSTLVATPSKSAFRRQDLNVENVSPKTKPTTNLLESNGSNPIENKKETKKALVSETSTHGQSGVIEAANTLISLFTQSSQCAL